MSGKLYPLRFESIPDVRAWGRETRVISGHATASTVVANGEFAGRTLADLTAEFGKELVGERMPAGGEFPLLFKVIEAREKLSVQVHPYEAVEIGGKKGEPKTEMWHVLEGEGTLYTGFKPGMRAEDIRAEAESGAIVDRLAGNAAGPGKAFFIPGGLVHAIGGGLKIYEVQQSSDTTYRLYDWGRKDAQGRGRELHLEAAMRVVRPELAVPEARTEIECEHFRFRSVMADGELEVEADAGSFTAVYVVGTGDSVLVPAGCGARIACSGQALLTTL